MKIPCDEYMLTHTVDETLEIYHGRAWDGSDRERWLRLVAGNTAGNHPPVQTLVDVTEIDEMCELGYPPRIIIHRGICHPLPAC